MRLALFDGSTKLGVFKKTDFLGPSAIPWLLSQI